MDATYRFCLVDPVTWRDNKVLEDVEDATIVYDMGLPTKGNMSFTMAGNIGESYIRAYMIAGGRTDCIGTFLAQTSKKSHNGRRGWWDVAAYTPLLELADDMPPVGYFAEGGYALNTAMRYIQSHCRALVSPCDNGSPLTAAFVADPSETNLDFLSNLVEKDGCYLMADPDGRITIKPSKAASAMQPVYRFTDDEASIIESDVDDVRDLYGIPNVVEVIGIDGMSSVAVNDDPASPLSVKNRGRIIRHREQNPNLPDGYTQDQLNEYTKRKLDGFSQVEHTVKFSYGWRPGINIGDCIQLDLDRSDIHTLAILKRAEMQLTAAARVTGTATYTEAV